MTEKEMLLTRDLEEAEILKGKILSREQETYLQYLFTEITLNNAQIDLDPDPAQRLASELARAHDAGKRSMIVELLNDSESAKAELATLNQTPNQPRS